MIEIINKLAKIQQYNWFKIVRALSSLAIPIALILVGAGCIERIPVLVLVPCAVNIADCLVTLSKKIVNNLKPVNKDENKNQLCPKTVSL